MTISERADALEQQLSDELDRAIPVPSALYDSGPRDPRTPMEVSSRNPKFAGKHFLMGADPRLPKMPDKPTLVDFFTYQHAAGESRFAEREARAQSRLR